ncbi:TIGR04372 family glycosyltransferase [bacterium]|nr:TIGR04372 family glycosyltransferase [bacterium]
MNYTNQYFVDYAFCNFKSDLLDIWLFANCNGCITTGTGLDTVSLIYQKPILFVNYLPIYKWWSFGNTITFFKNLYWIKTSKALTLEKNINNSYTNKNSFIKKRIKIIDLSAEEIKEAVKEFIFL